ncbi:MAG: transketolase, partial [Firmicutes bacterium]|nr:transketolase [Bacillota bacterium]
ALSGHVPDNFESMISTFEAGTKNATRNTSGKVLQQVAKAIPYLAGGSADLAPSTKTWLDGEGEIGPGSFGGRNFHFGVREHAMAAICNGISLHGGIRPYCATFLVFVDYLRPSLRLSAMMKQPVIYVLTHDSVYVGEDGPTHEPIEQTESIRIIPNCRVFRPADANETRLAWIEAIRRKDGPTCLILTRQNLPTIPAEAIPVDGFSKGGYVLKRESSGQPDVVLVAAGSEVSLCMETAQMLEADGLKVRVVSVPSRELFLAQDPEYRSSVLTSAPKVAVEIGVGEGWYQITGCNGMVYSLQRFGESGPGPQVAAHLGFTAGALRDAIKAKLGL